MAVLYCVPLGCTARRLFYEHMRQHAYEDSILVLPNRQLRLQAQKEAAVNCGGIDELASKILNNNGYVYLDEINRRSQELVTRDLLEYLGNKSKLAYFQRLTDKKGFVKAVASVLGQLSRSGATEQQIHTALTERGGEKDKELAELYVLYRQYLKNNKWFDLEGKYRLAVSVLAAEKVKMPWKHIYISDFYSFDVLQLEFLRALSKHCQLTIGLMYEAGREGVFQAAENSYAALAGFCQVERYMLDLPQQEDLQYLRQKLFTAADMRTAENITLCHFKSREDEVRWTLTQVKQLLRQGVAAENILVTVRSLRDYNGIRQTADEYGIPVSLAHTAQLAVQPLTEFIMLALTAAGGGRSGAEAYSALLCSELGKLIFSSDTEQVQKLRQYKYYSSVAALQEDYHALLADDEDAALTRTEQLLQELPASGCLADYLTLLTDFIKDLHLPQLLGKRYQLGELPLNGIKSCLTAQEALLGCFGDLVKDYKTCHLDENVLSLAQLQEILAEAAREIEITLAEGRADGVLVAEVVNVQGRQYEQVFLMGVRESEFPAGSSENWLYDDKERAELTALGIDMPTTAQAYAEDDYFFAVTVAQCASHLTVTWHEDDAAGASAYVDELCKLFSNAVIAEPVKEPASMAELLQEAERWEEGWLSKTIGASALTAAAADKLRASREVYNGKLQDAELQKQVAKKAGRTFSASRLEVYAACPFSFLGQYIWGESGSDEKSENIEPADEGSLLHEVLAKFVGRHLREKLCKHDFALLQKELLADFDAVFTVYAEQHGAKDNVFWQSEVRRMKNLLLQWLQYEYGEQRQWEEFVPCAAELSFRRSEGTALPLKLSDGSSVQLEGRIDRIDSDGSRLFITDYKRSAAPSGSDLPAGLDLQLPVYLLAAAAMQPEKRVAGGGYLVLKQAKRQASIGFEKLGNTSFKVNDKLFADAEAPWESFEAFSRGLLAKYVESIYSGDFSVQPQKSCSDFCPLKNICRIGLIAGERSEEDG